jgi:tRNA-splicing ligase RtcB
MSHLNLKGEELKQAGVPQGPMIGLAIKIIQKNFRKPEKEEVLGLVRKLVLYPENFLDDEVFYPLAAALAKQARQQQVKAAMPKLKPQTGEYRIYGKEFIEQGALDQMDVAMRLPVTVGGALMPDAHQGYGLPIGGVLATKNAVIPYGVGVDIGCRMALSVYDIPEETFLGNTMHYKRELVAWTKFGAGGTWKGKEKADHEILEDPLFNEIPLLRSLYGKATEQLGTSGGGNHFVEWGIIEFLKEDRQLNVPAGKYLALLSHSGSRGLGATIANHYTKLAKEICQLPAEAKNLAYLDLHSAEGQEYWLAMNLAGNYASACHRVIHERLTRAIGGNLLARVENHHNFAWREKLDGEDVIVHRKGATPASKNLMGIIPGSMVAPGFLVRGKGEAGSLNSAAHGAGRRMSRTQAIKTIDRLDMLKMLKDHGVTLVGAGLDEAPMAYKNIETVMEAQSDLVDVIARFDPKIVRMADDGSRED